MILKTTCMWWLLNTHFSLQLFSMRTRFLHLAACLTPLFRCRKSVMTQRGLCFSPQTQPTLSLLHRSFQMRSPGKLQDSSSLLTISPSTNSVYSVSSICHVILFLFCSTTIVPTEATVISTVSLQQPTKWFLWILSCSPPIHYSYWIWNKGINFLSLCCRKPFNHLPLILNPYHDLQTCLILWNISFMRSGISSLSFSILSLVLNIIFSMWKAFDKYLLKKWMINTFTILPVVICVNYVLPAKMEALWKQEPWILLLNPLYLITRKIVHHQYRRIRSSSLAADMAIQLYLKHSAEWMQHEWKLDI